MFKPVHPPKPTSFPKFHHLPLEIQYTIWHFACEDYASENSRILRVAKDPLGKRKSSQTPNFESLRVPGFQLPASCTSVSLPGQSHSSIGHYGHTLILQCIMRVGHIPTSTKPMTFSISRTALFRTSGKSAV